MKQHNCSTLKNRTPCLSVFLFAITALLFTTASMATCGGGEGACATANAVDAYHRTVPGQSSKACSCTPLAGSFKYQGQTYCVATFYSGFSNPGTTYAACNVTNPTIGIYRDGHSKIIASSTHNPIGLGAKCRQDLHKVVARLAAGALAAGISRTNLYIKSARVTDDRIYEPYLRSNGTKTCYAKASFSPSGSGTLKWTVGQPRTVRIDLFD